MGLWKVANFRSLFEKMTSLSSLSLSDFPWRRPNCVLPASSALLGLITVCVPIAASAQSYNGLIQSLIQGAAPLVGSQEPPPPPAPPSQYQQQAPFNYQSPSQNAYRPPQPAYQLPRQQRLTTPYPSGLPDTRSVAQLQRELDKLGYDAGPADGAWGGRSIAALRAFQADHALAPDGKLNAATIRAVQVSSSANQGQQPTTTANASSATPSFSCERASSSSEIAICSNPELAALDRQLADIYIRAAADPGAFPDIATQQRVWISRRNTCRGNVECLHQSMAGRIAELQGAMGQANGSAQTGISPVLSSGADLASPIVDHSLGPLAAGR
jgi:hypothetical protein